MLEHKKTNSNKLDIHRVKNGQCKISKLCKIGET
jgi:hypothetical protein